VRKERRGKHTSDPTKYRSKERDGSTNPARESKKLRENVLTAHSYGFTKKRTKKLTSGE